MSDPVAAAGVQGAAALLLAAAVLMPLARSPAAWRGLLTAQALPVAAAALLARPDLYGLAVALLVLLGQAALVPWLIARAPVTAAPAASPAGSRLVLAIVAVALAALAASAMSGPAQGVRMLVTVALGGLATGLCVTASGRGATRIGGLAASQNAVLLAASALPGLPPATLLMLPILCAATIALLLPPGRLAR